MSERPVIPMGMAVAAYDVRDDYVKWIHWEAGHYRTNGHVDKNLHTFKLAYVPLHSGTDSLTYSERRYASCAELEELGAIRIIPDIRDDND